MVFMEKFDSAVRFWLNTTPSALLGVLDVEQRAILLEDPQSLYAQLRSVALFSCFNPSFYSPARLHLLVILSGSGHQ